MNRHASWLVLAALGCHHGGASSAPSPSESGFEVAADAGAAALVRDPMVEDLWAKAAEGDLADLARLYDREGDTGLIERAAVPAFRMTALAALGCGEGFTALPYLAEAALAGTEPEADAALSSAESLAVVPRRARDPEDALELRRGCETLLALARKVDAAPARRTRAVSVLRMLESTGCLHGQAPPTDLDPK